MKEQLKKAFNIVSATALIVVTLFVTFAVVEFVASAFYDAFTCRHYD
jgi:hypothetical protein